ncbi:hypothetical protein SIN8267_01038 [Sinobacterium norvegicum]|uniref:Uncharacterized protein n=1 Tax=Sinobacterium norvegicum TaxID=1641715 RepID=A0ABM9AE06_9GAMM|nr:hypothetical protein [Sinobacterium norvegicum]CAH0990937.1 hypothetical protein SIN8267_01038 [Sinobacterium norvegicum]
MSFIKNYKASILLAIAMLPLIALPILYLTSDDVLKSLAKYAVYHSNISRCSNNNFVNQHYRQSLTKATGGREASWGDYRQSISIYLPSTTRAIRLYLNENIHQYGASTVVDIDPDEMICRLSNIYDDSIGFDGIDSKGFTNNLPLHRQFVSLTNLFSTQTGSEFNYRINLNCPTGGRDFNQNVWAIGQINRRSNHWQFWYELAPLFNNKHPDINKQALDKAFLEFEPITNSPRQIADLTCLLSTL